MGKLSLAVLISAAIHGYFMYMQPKTKEITLSSGGQTAEPSLSVVAINTNVVAKQPPVKVVEEVAEPSPVEAKPTVKTIAPAKVTPEPVTPKAVAKTPTPVPANPKPADLKPVVKEIPREKQPAKPREQTQLAQSKPPQPQQAKETPTEPLKPAAKPDTKREPVEELANTKPAVSQVNSQSQPDQGLSKLPRINTQPRFASPPSAPVYPRVAKKRGLEGTVMVEVWLDPAGRQTKREINSSSGIKSLDKAALKAVKRWQFKGLIVDGQAQASRALIPIRFKLS
ncbi:energy transducer TonB [Agarivorans sp. Alg241-V36]|uniref:energy transducer TonB n=1 Tax=Agarivorans sp. Alg241-V36 TaxID=2305992 RepID=UPI0013D7F58E|nr:energy transducer TonB [Agarivorans sp. Alg241-V36]